MLDVNQYLENIKSLLIVNSAIKRFHVLREISQKDLGLYRIRAKLTNGDFIELFEFFKIIQGKIKIDKYSFHWQMPSGELIKRWDNAPHFPKIKTFPHHLHEGNDDNVLPILQPTLKDILNEVVEYYKNI